MDITWLQFLLLALATYRLALLFAKESGPGRIFKKLRLSTPPKSAAREGLECLHCESIWWAAPVTVFAWWRELVDLWGTPILWIALSGAAIILHHAFTENFKKK